MTYELENFSTEEETKRLLQLKLIPSNLRTIKQQLEISKLSEARKSYSKLIAREMQLKFQNKPDLLTLSIHSPGNSALVSQDYVNKFANKLGYPKPFLKNGMVSLTFQSEQDAADFLLSQASKGRKFRVVDSQHRLLAISNGKGLVQHADGRPFTAIKPLNDLSNTPQNNQALQQEILLRPFMSPSQSTVLMKARMRQLLSTPRPIFLAPGSLDMAVAKPQFQRMNEIKYPTPRPTPFKRTPYD